MLSFGKSSKGKVVHVLVAGEPPTFTTALCDKKQTGLVVDKSLDLKDVTCAKCKQYKVFKEALIAEHNAEQNPLVAETEKGKKEIKKKIKKEKKVTPVKEPVLDFQKEEKTGGLFQIIHVPSGLHFFDKIEKEVVDRALSRLNDIEIEWKINEKMPKEFITQCRKALRIAYNQSGIEIPDGLAKSKDPVENVKKEEKTKRKVEKKPKKDKKNKKEKEAKRTIKRRDKKPEVKEKKEKKLKKKTQRQIIYEFIQEKMVKGIKLSDLIGLLIEDFDLSAKKANSKMKGNIRRMRKRGVEISIRLTQKKEDDFYKIVK